MRILVRSGATMGPEVGPGVLGREIAAGWAPGR